ncbi:MAG: YceD family protein [Gammaproteobacteria bacterium]
MAKGQLPKEIEPIRLADRGAVLQGSLSFQEMPRLLEVIVNTVGEIYIFLNFAKDEQGIRSICGKIQTTLALTCQRCLQPVAYPVDVAVRVWPVASESEIAEMPENYDPLLVTAEPMRLTEIIEEEILLSLPIVAKHATGKCPVKLEWNYPSRLK